MNSRPQCRVTNALLKDLKRKTGSLSVF